MVEPFVSAIRKYLPNSPIEEYLLATRTARRQLAADLKTAMEREGATPTLPKNTTPMRKRPHFKGNRNRRA
jgi:hypothetical protein